MGEERADRAAGGDHLRRSGKVGHQRPAFVRLASGRADRPDQGVVHHEVAGREQDRLDGLTVDCGPWWFNLRPSNTEPLLRLNLEAPTRDECDDHVAEVLALITAV